MYPINEYILHDLYPLAKITKSEYWRLLLLLLRRGFEVWKTWLTYFHQLQIQNEFHINNRCSILSSMYYCTNDFLNVSENPFNTHYVPSQLWIGQELLSFVLYYCITIVPFDFWVNEVKWKEIKLFFHPDKLGWYLICCISKVCWYSTCNVFSHYVLRYNCFVFQRKWISIVNRSCSFFPKNCNGHTYTKLF